MIENIYITGDSQMNGSGVITITFNNKLLSTGGDIPKGDYSTIVKWTTPDLGIDYFVSSSTRTNLSYGVYLVEYSMGFPGNSGVTSFEPITITVSSGITASIIDVDNTTCGINNGKVTGYTSSIYENSIFDLYTTNNELIQQNKFSTQYGFFEGLSAGTYYITVDDNNGSTARTETFIINQTNKFDFGLYVVPNSNCQGLNSGKIFVTGITGTPPYTYLWNDFSISDSLTGLTNGVYSVTVTDSKNCSLSKSAYINSVPPLGIENIITNSPSCFESDGNINLTISGGTAPFYYKLSNGFSTISYSNNLNVVNLGYGTYTLTVVDAALCNIETSVQLVSVDGGISEVMISSKNSNCSSYDGSITVGVVNGLPPFTYSLTDSLGNKNSKISYQSEYVFDGLSGDTYIIGISDSGNCSTNQTVVIENVNKFSISTTITGTTFQQSNGVISVSLSEGGTAPYTYTLDNVIKVSQSFLTEVVINYVSSGIHTLSVTDGLGCIQTVQIFVPILEPTNFFLYGEKADLGNNGKINVLITSGVPPFTFYWSPNVLNNPQSISVENLSAGTYSVKVIDSNGTSLTRELVLDGKVLLSSYETYEMGSSKFSVSSGSKYELGQLLVDGYNELILGENNCEFTSAIFYAEVQAQPMGIVISEPFYTSTNLNDIPSDNLWYNKVKTLLLQIKGVKNVEIDPINNKFDIVSDVNNSEIIDGSVETMRISIDLNIEYNIKCR